MGRFILELVDKPGWYVNQPGDGRSYTADLRKAQRFPTREAAERAKCGNERVIDLFELFGF